jgi:translation initiation factor 2 subunit 3
MKRMQPEMNVVMLGHVDHGKTSITKSLSGVWTDTHSEELKRGITIKMGYADINIYKCSSCKGAESYGVSEICEKCGFECELVRKLSLLDAPGHETLMTTAISASSITDGAILVIAANEPCPQPQTAEHLNVLEILDVDNIIVIQNKVDIVGIEKAKENYNQIKEFLKGTKAEKAPIIPMVANQGLNTDVLLQTIYEKIPVPKRDVDADLRMYVARSFDVNKPGSDIQKIKGAIIGGSIIQGQIKEGQEIEIAPGIIIDKKKGEFETIKTKVQGIRSGDTLLSEAGPGGLLALSTLLDPSLAKSDGLVGQIVGLPGTLPPAVKKLKMRYKLISRLLEDDSNLSLQLNEPIVLSVGTAITVGIITTMKKDLIEVALKRPIVVEKKSKVAISKRAGNRWKLSGYGIIE